MDVRSEKHIEKIIAGKKQRMRLACVTAVMMLAVVCVTAYILKRPAIGMTEADGRVLSCQLQVHQHTPECYNEEGILVCGEADFVVHSHDSSCYDKDGTLLCTLPEIAEHVHDDSCMRQQIVCGKEEDEAHTHDESCMEPLLLCGKDEVALHVHGTDCYDDNGQLICGQIEVSAHTHGADCFETAGQTEEPTEESRTMEEKDASAGSQLTESEYAEDVQETVEAETAVETESMAETVTEEETAETMTEIESVDETASTTDTETTAEDETVEETSTIQETAAVSTARKARARVAVAATTNPTLTDCQEIIDIFLGDTVTTPTIQAGKRIYYRYTNYTKHTVQIESFGSVDTYVYLMDRNGKQIAYNDDADGTNRNFKLTKSLEPGETYYWGVKFYSTSATGTITFSLISTTDHSYVDGVCSCGKKQNECGIYGNESNVTWSLGEDGTLYIDGNGAMENYHGFSTPWNDLRDQITQVVIGPGVTTVGYGAFDDCTQLRTVTIQSQNLESVDQNAFTNCTSLEKIVLNDTVDAMSGTALDALKASGIQFGFEGAHVFQLTDNAVSFGNSVLPAGRYYVNESGAFYLLKEGTATLVYCPEKLDGSDLSQLFCDFTTPEGETYAVTAIGEWTFAGLEKLTSITIPETVTDIGSYAFAGCSNLTQVNGGTTLTEIYQRLPYTAIRYSAFFDTALWEHTVSNDSTLFTNENLELSKKDDGNHYRLQLKITEGVGASWVDSTYGTIYTGQSVQLTINLDQTETSVSDKLRIYFQMEDGNSVYDAENNTLFGNAIGSPQIYTSNGKEVVGTFYVSDADVNQYYLELSSIDPGDTLTMYLNAGYPNFTVGGEMLCWLDDSAGQEQPAAIKRIKWITKRDSFKLSKTSGSSSVTIKGDGTGNDLAWVSGLSYTISTTRDSESISYGKNPMDYMDFTDTLTLPQGFAISQDVIDAIQNGQWKTKWESYSWNIYVMLNEDGTSKDVLLARIGMGSNSYKQLVQNIEPLIDDQNRLQLRWRFVNQAAQAEILLPSMTITYGGSVICGDVQVLKALMEAAPNQTSFKTVFHNEVEQTQNFRFGGVEQKQAEANKTVTIGQADFVISKSTSDYPAMGMDNIYTITLTNNTAFPYTNLEQVYDEMYDRYYIKPENMQKMFEASDGQKLTITISNAKICKTDSKTVTAIDGNTYTINQELTSDHSTYNIGQSGSDREGGLVNLLLSWDGDHLKLVMTPSSDADTEQTYTIGAEQDYETIQALFDDLGIIVIKQTRYKCLWNQEGVTLRSGEAKKFLIYSTAKSTFQYLETDQRREYMTASSSEYIYNYAYAKYSGSTTATKYAYVRNYVYKDFTLRKTVAKSGKTVDEQTELVAGDILTYTNAITRHPSGTAFDATPLVDQMAGGQVLLVEQEANTDLARYDLETKAVDGTTYYVMSRPGTYKNVTIGGYLADTLEIQQNDTGLQTRMYWYLKSSTTSINVTYKAVIDPSVVTSGDGNGVTYSLRNDVWLGDHEGHRLYDTTFFNGITLSTSKYIVTNCDQVDGTHQPQTDVLEKYSLVQSGQQVLYRIAITSVGEDYTLMLPGSAIKDILPGSVENGWSKEDISITYIAEKGSTVIISDETSDAWTVVNGTVDSGTGKSTQSIQWNDGFFMQVKGTVYIYVTLTFPEGDDWEAYTHAYGSESLYNTWKIYNVTDQVEHLTSCQAKGVLQKGVYYTGTSTSTAAKTSNTSKNYSLQSSANSRLYYTNDTNSNSAVTYYAVLYNSGDSRLYVSQLQDVLPKGFTFGSLYYSASYLCYYNMYSGSNYMNSYTYYYNWLDGINDGQKVSITNLKASIKASTSTNIDGRQVVTFTVTGASSDTPTLSYDERTGKCYLMPGQALVLMYNCYTNGYDDTEDDAVNFIFMPYDDYNGGGITLEEDVSFTPNKNTSITANDGSALLLSSSQAASLGASTDGQTDNTRWLASQVTISRGRIQPGIQKTCSVSNAGSNDTIEWKVQSTNSGTDALRDYVITDVMMAPYTFDGTVYYQINTSSTKLFDISQLKAEGQGETEFNNTSFGKITARLDRNADGNQVLTIHFQDSAKAGIPAGGSTVLTVYTKNTTSTHENKTYINQAYLTPMKQTFSKSDVHQGNYITYTCAGEETARRSVVSEAQAIVSFGYATSAHKTVTELEQGQDGTLTVTDNSARSDKATNSIILSNGEDSIFRYDLSVNNSGSATATPTNMDLFVLVDNLPEAGDHATFYQDYARSSEFRVDFLAENLNLTVTLTKANGTARQMDADEYDLMFSMQTEFDYDDSDAYSKKLWTGEALTEADGWYTLEQCEQSGTLADMRSVRVVIKDPGHAKNIMPGGVTISIDFNARVHQGSNPDYSATAWNSFGYLYEVDGAQLQSAPEKVGVKIVGAPYLEKQLQDYRGAAVTAEQDETFQFLIYKGKNQNLDSTDSIEHLMEQLAANNIAFTVATRTVPAGASTSSSLPLDDLKNYVYDEQTDSWVSGSENWIWENDATYTMMELSTASDSAYSFYTLDGGRINGMTFQYDETASPEYVAVNQLKTWLLEVKKQDEVSGEALSGAVFGLYTLKPELAMQAADLPEEVKEHTEMTINRDGQTWYLMDVKTSDDNGNLSWTALTEDSYYLYELQAPEGYAICEKEGIKISKALNGKAPLTVKNMQVFEIPKTGGTGAARYIIWGSGLMLLAVLLWIARAKSKTDR